VEDLDTARGALAAGAADYVSKPFTLQYLDSVLAIHLPADARPDEHRPAVPQASLTGS
jgi:DNA-binding NtrC family response regulator